MYHSVVRFHSPRGDSKRQAQLRPLLSLECLFVTHLWRHIVTWHKLDRFPVTRKIASLIRNIEKMLLSGKVMWNNI